MLCRYVVIEGLRCHAVGGATVTVTRCDVFREGLLTGKLAFITGGSSGINRTIAERFARAGARVAILGRNLERAQRAAADIQSTGAEALALAADVRDAAAVETTLQSVHDRWGPIDIVLAGAAGNFVAPALGMNARGFKAVVDIDLLGTFNTVRAAFAFMRRPGSTVVAISAVQSTLPTAAQAHVCAAKAGVEMLIRTLSIEWARDGIRCLAIAPGPVAHTEGMRRLAPDGQHNLDRLLSAIPSNRQASRDEIADLALFLVSGAADYVNGAVIPIDGGMSNLGSHAFGEMLVQSVADTGAA
jgi:NAD(P)-dependent dehydrogenase (short-subunit alcohol dehydrogenase family)